MRQIELQIASQGIRLRVWLADRWWSRAQGVLGRSALPVGQGLLLSPCSSVHGIGMVRSLDLVFLDPSGTIIKTGCLHPLGLAWHRNAKQVLEMRSGEIQRLGLQCGQQIELLS